ncbi:MAG: dephospho-CoA kinase [Spirochaetaceae bacterium]|jgi:dephospho-CoA kinase|nr:dephospho-CoA kinase [Spirochaetaceae bacterium]
MFRTGRGGGATIFSEMFRNSWHITLTKGNGEDFTLIYQHNSSNITIIRSKTPNPVPRKQMLIGLTGLSCAGKNYVARLLLERGCRVLDADELAHEVLDEQKAAVLTRWGEGVLDTNGKVSRQALGAAVFGNQEKLSALENLLYPAIDRKILEWVEGGEQEISVINAAVLHKSAVFEKLDLLVIVRAPYLTRLFRAKFRDKRTFRQIIRRFRSQHDFLSQYFTKNADICIIENGGIGIFPFRSAMKKKIDRLMIQFERIEAIKESREEHPPMP